MIRNATESDLQILADAMVRLQMLHVDAFPNVYKTFTTSSAVSHLADLIARPEFKDTSVS